MAIQNKYGITEFSTSSVSDANANIESGYTFMPFRDIYITGFRINPSNSLGSNTIKLWDYDTHEIIVQTGANVKGSNVWLDASPIDNPIRLIANKKYTISINGGNRRTAAIANVETDEAIEIIEGCYILDDHSYPTIINATEIYALLDICFETFDYKYLVRNMTDTVITGIETPRIDNNVFINSDTEEICFLEGTSSKILYFSLVKDIEYTFKIVGQSNKCIIGTTDKNPELFVDLETRALLRTLKNEPILNEEPTLDNPITINFIAENGEEYCVAYLSDREEDIPETELQGKGNYQLYTYDEETYQLSEIYDFKIDSELFLNYGKATIPLLELIQTNQELSYPSVLYWEEIEREENPILKADVKALPPNQVIISDKVDLTHSSIIGIESATVNCQGDPQIAISLDKETWKIWANEQWVNISGQFTGMSKTVIESINIDGWNQLIFTDDEHTNKIDGFYFRIALTNTAQSIKEIYLTFINT